MNKTLNIVTTNGEQSREQAILVIVNLEKRDNLWSNQDEINEMTDLVYACGGHVVETIICNVKIPSARNLIGEGKVQEILDLLDKNKIDTVIFNHDLKGSQQRNLEDALKTKTIDRTQLILDIFALQAKSREGKIQVELAQLQYLLPRLTGKGIELSRLGGGIGTLGPGETKLEMDRRRIEQKIDRLKKDLKEVAHNRALTRKKRQDQGIPLVSLVGYTNAGKSTLLNTLTDAGQITKDGLFTTLDSLSRQLILPNHQKVVISDTVGFMNNLPHHLIESFKATLEEVKESDLILHVVDVSHPKFRHLYDSVVQVLRELESLQKLTIVVLNKIDKLDEPQAAKSIEANFDQAVNISAKNKTNIDQLLKKISDLLSSLYIEIDVDLPLDRMDLVNFAHEKGEVVSIKYYNDKINLRVSIPSHLAGKFKL